MSKRIGFRRWPFQTRIGRFWRHEFTTVTRYGFKVPFSRWGLFVDIVRLVPKPKPVRCPSTYLGVPCRKPGGTRTGTAALSAAGGSTGAGPTTGSSTGSPTT